MKNGCYMILNNAISLRFAFYETKFLYSVYSAKTG